jgi:hypothetical protein
VHIVGWNTAGDAIDVGSRHALTLLSWRIPPKLKPFDMNVPIVRITGIRRTIPELD